MTEKAPRFGIPEEKIRGWRRGLCRWCLKPVEGNRRTFCRSVSTGREHLGTIIVPRPYRPLLGPFTMGSGCVHEWRLRTDGNYIRHSVEARDAKVCALCSRVDPKWEADHIVPVVEGGGGCGLEGYRTLCRPCHVQVTRELRARLSTAKKTKAA